MRQCGSEACAKGADDQAFTPDHGDRAPSRRAERRADRQVAGPPANLHQGQPGDVGHGDQPQRTDRREYEDEPAPRRADSCVFQRPDLDRPPGVGLRELLRQLLLHEREIASGLLDRDARFEPADAVLEARFPLPQQPRVDLSRQPDVGRCGGERCRHHADDRISLAADRQRPANRRRVAIEAPRPETLADHRRVRAGIQLLVPGEPAAGERRLCVNLEEPRRHAHAGKALGLLTARLRQALGVGRGDRDEGPVGAVPVLEAARRHEASPVTRRGAQFVDRDQRVGVGVGQRLDEDRVDQREHGGGDASAEGQRQHRCGEERRPSRQRSPGLPPCPHLHRLGLRRQDAPERWQPLGVRVPSLPSLLPRLESAILFAKCEAPSSSSRSSFSASAAGADVRHVWAVNDGEKVERDA